VKDIREESSAERSALSDEASVEGRASSVEGERTGEVSE
jgi:hypothetical protein